MESSPLSSDFFPLGYINNTHGLKGEVKLHLYKKTYETLLSSVKKCLLDNHSYAIEKSRLTPKGAILKLQGINIIEAALVLKTSIFYVDKSILNLLPTVFLSESWIGHSVYTEAKVYLGIVEDIIYTGCNDVLVVVDNKIETLIPVIESYILETSSQEKTIIVQQPEYA